MLAVVNLKHIFDLENIGVNYIDHHLMVDFGEKDKIKKAGN